MSSESAPSVIAIGGHSLLDPDLPPTVANQFEVTREAMRSIADLLECSVTRIRRGGRPAAPPNHELEEPQL